MRVHAVTWHVASRYSTSHMSHFIQYRYWYGICLLSLFSTNLGVRASLCFVRKRGVFNKGLLLLCWMGRQSATIVFNCRLNEFNIHDLSVLQYVWWPMFYPHYVYMYTGRAMCLCCSWFVFILPSILFDKNEHIFQSTINVSFEIWEYNIFFFFF